MIPTEVQARPAWSFESKTSPQGQHVEHQVIVERIRASVAVDGPRENRRKERGASSLCQRTEHHRQPVDGRSSRRIHRVVRGQCDVDEELRGGGSGFLSVDSRDGRADGLLAVFETARNRGLLSPLCFASSPTTRKHLPMPVHVGSRCSSCYSPQSL